MGDDLMDFEDSRGKVGTEREQSFSKARVPSYSGEPRINDFEPEKKRRKRQPKFEEPLPSL